MVRAVRFSCSFSGSEFGFVRRAAAHLDGPGDDVLESGSTSGAETNASPSRVDEPMQKRGDDGRVETDCIPKVRGG